MGLFNFIGDLFEGVGEIVGDIAGAVTGAVTGGGGSAAAGGVAGALLPSASNSIISSIFGGSEDVLDTGMSLFAPRDGPAPGSWLNSTIGGHVLQGVGQALLAPDQDDITKQAKEIAEAQAQAQAQARVDAESQIMRERQNMVRENYGLGPQSAYGRSPQAAPGVIDTGAKYKKTGLTYG